MAPDFLGLLLPPDFLFHGGGGLRILTGIARPFVVTSNAFVSFDDKF